VKVWLIVVLAFLALVTRYGLPMRPAHALLALRWSDQVTQPVYENHPTDCVRMWAGLCRHETPVAVSLAFDDPFLASSVEPQPSLKSRWLLRGLDVVLDALECPTEFGQQGTLQALTQSPGITRFAGKTAKTGLLQQPLARVTF
jgi:hypothetical protein